MVSRAGSVRALRLEDINCRTPLNPGGFKRKGRQDQKMHAHLSTWCYMTNDKELADTRTNALVSIRCHIRCDHWGQW